MVSMIKIERKKKQREKKTNGKKSKGKSKRVNKSKRRAVKRRRERVSVRFLLIFILNFSLWIRKEKENEKAKVER